MADEKPKDLTGLSQALETLRQLSGEKSLADTGTAFSQLPTDVSKTSILEYINSIVDEDRKQRQKKAAETNLVDNAAANAWFNEHWPQPRKCGVCTQMNWAMSPSFAHVPLASIGGGAATATWATIGTQPSVRTFWCVVVTCLTCGNTIFFNALVMGQLPKDEV